MALTLENPLLALPAAEFREHALSIFGCKNCKRLCYLDRAGLCQKCYRTPAVRAQFQTRESIPLGSTPDPRVLVAHYPLAPMPTDYLPGSVEKMLVMRLRIEAGFAALHPDDAEMPKET